MRQGKSCPAILSLHEAARARGQSATRRPPACHAESLRPLEFIGTHAGPCVAEIGCGALSGEVEICMLWPRMSTSYGGWHGQTRLTVNLERFATSEKHRQTSRSVPPNRLRWIPGLCKGTCDCPAGPLRNVVSRSLCRYAVARPWLCMHERVRP